MPTRRGFAMPRAVQIGARWLVRLDWFVQPAAAFVLSRMLIFAAGIAGDVFLPTEEGHWVADINSSFLSLWAKWDSQWYVQIARGGYLYQPLQQSNVAFFPLYPMSMRLLAPLVGGNLVLAGFLLSNAFFLAALIFLYQLARLEIVDAFAASQADASEAARRTVFYLAFFPTAFFLSAVYTESLFLLLSVATIYFARRRRWVLAALAGLLAAATRNLGVVLWLLVMWEWLRCHGWRVTRIHRANTWRSLWSGIKSDWVDVVILAAIPLGLLLYMAYLQLSFGRPMAFIEVQAAWDRQNIGPAAVVMRELRALAEFELNKSNLSRMLNLSAFLGVLAMTPFIWRRLGEGYAIYVLVLLLVPASSALQSMSRYILPMFPVFILLGRWGRLPIIDRAILATFAVLLGVLTTIYVNWVFVA
jgi:hypothetical protein